MWLMGHLQMLSVVDCGVYDSESKIDEVLLWKVFYDLHGFFSIYVYDCCLISCRKGRILFSIIMIESLIELLATGALWLSVHPGQWSPKGSRFAGVNVQRVILSQKSFLQSVLIKSPTHGE